MTTERFLEEILGRFKGTAAEQKIKNWVRETAIQEAEKKIRLLGKHVDDYSDEEFEVIVADAEVDVGTVSNRKV